MDRLSLLIPPYLADWQMWRDLIPIPLFALLVAWLVQRLAVRLQTGDGERPAVPDPRAFAVVSAFAMLGMTIGVLTGLSQSPVVGAVVPAVLTLIGGVAAFLLGGKTTASAMHGPAIAIIGVVSFTLLTGTFWGAELRTASDQRANSYFAQKAALEQAHHLNLLRLRHENQLAEIRQALPALRSADGGEDTAPAAATNPAATGLPAWMNPPPPAPRLPGATPLPWNPD